MSDTIFHLSSEGSLTELKEANYISEDLLQQLLAQHPNLLAGSQIDKARPRRWLLIDREFGVPDQEDANSRWSLDHLFIDQDGIPTLVEVKRSTDTRIRREVIGQILDYAANAVTYWLIDSIKHRFEEQCTASGKDTQTEIYTLLQTEANTEDFWELVKTNLKAGKIRMLIVADTIPKELQRIIEFLNEQMKPAEILGVEIKQFISHDSQKTLVPRVIGKTATADSVKGKATNQPNQWNEETFFESLTEQCGQEQAQVARKILSWITPYCKYIWYGKGRTASMFPVPNLSGNQYSPVFALWANGYVELQFQRMTHPFDNEQKRLELLHLFSEIDNLDFPKGKIFGRPSFPIKILLQRENLQKFFEACGWFLTKSGVIKSK
ncbi:PDDEXK family nuclease [Pontibacter chinhatensis]|uniref:DUF4268 domain-containing protein n=1 Tax=Pontibacter chinhatensis TaxID=1436961 RepID=A0A1I2ZNQ4_9BACT|nr:hypothetical protein [Pontibacter chinhatensis]SFH39236.1 hypothetical protein SAMN05421739_11624 [Pontibacter chinhatensis]